MGEKELGCPVQPLNDRAKVNKPYSQVGFIEFFVAPFALSIAKLFPTLAPCTELMMDNLELWFRIWIQETKPDPSEQVKILDRICKLETKIRTRRVSEHSSLSIN